MAVYKEPKTNTWRVIYRYTDWNGERKQSQKRGFQTKREAQSWEREQLNKLGSDLDMTFRSFVEHYEEDRRSRIKDSTWESKEHIIRTKLLPYFGKLKMSSITPQQIVRWQNELISYGGFVLSKEKRTSNAAVLDVTGRDQEDQRLHLNKNPETLVPCRYRPSGRGNVSSAGKADGRGGRYHGDPES